MKRRATTEDYRIYWEWNNYSNQWLGWTELEGAVAVLEERGRLFYGYLTSPQGVDELEIADRDIVTVRKTIELRWCQRVRRRIVHETARDVIAAASPHNPKWRTV